MKDNFSLQSDHYARFLPVYPQALFDFLLSNTPQRAVAWDAGTGNGQVAAVLSRYFEKVHATDISTRQLGNAPVLDNVHYAQESAGQCSLPDRCCDLITVGQAAHWFPLPEFYAEVRRVMRPGGLLAIWGYGLMHAALPAITSLIVSFYKNTTGPYWDAERKHLDEGYANLPFPFVALETPAFAIEVHWRQEHLSGYLQTWSAVQHFIRENGFDPVPAFMEQVAAVWPEEKEEVVFNFPVFMRAARVLS